MKFSANTQECDAATERRRAQMFGAPSWARGRRRATVAWRRDAFERGRSRRHARGYRGGARVSAEPALARSRRSISRRSIPRVVKAETFTRRARGKSTGRVRAAGTGGDAPQERRDVHRGERVGPRAAGLRADGLVRGRFHGHHGGGGELCASLCGRYWGNVVLGPLCRRGDKSKPPAPRADESSLIRVVKKCNC